MNPNLNQLKTYPFAKLNRLKSGISPRVDKAHISLAIGEPKTATPGFIRKELAQNSAGLNLYPLTKGSTELREVISLWLTKRFGLAPGMIDHELNVLPVNGSREALFSFAQAVINPASPVGKPLVLIPNPFYQIYEGAALLAGAQTGFINCTADNNFFPDFDEISEDEWNRCQLLYICSPNNPTGKVYDLKTLRKLIGLAVKHDFIIASDECYCEIYPDENRLPPGLLTAAQDLGCGLENLMVFHSLSKRSSAPGLRSGFVAGDPKIIDKFFLYRTYHGSAMPYHHQHASIKAWSDEEHVINFRRFYRNNFQAFIGKLSPKIEVYLPDGAFYLWAKVPVSDVDFTRGLYEHENITVLPGSFLARQANGINPGANFIRLALVAETENCLEAAGRINNFVENVI